MSFLKNIKIFFAFNLLIMPLMSYGMLKSITKSVSVSPLLVASFLQHKIARCDEDGNVRILNFFDSKELEKHFGQMNLVNVTMDDCYYCRRGQLLCGEPNIGSKREFQEFLTKNGASDKAADYIETILAQLIELNSDIRLEGFRLALKDVDESAKEWHIDYNLSCDYDCKSSRVRFSVPLQGLGTEYANLTPEQRLLIAKSYCQDKHTYHALAENVEQILQPGQISQVQLGQVARFEGGCMHTGVIHRSPSNPGDRLTLIVSAALKY
jgi:hypothetical protein